MNLFRLILLAGVALIVGVIAPARAASADAVASSTQNHVALGANFSGSHIAEQKKKADPPPRPRPPRGPKDGGEDE